MKKVQRKAKADTVVGQAKQTSGVVSGNRSLEREGELQEARGKLRERLGSTRRHISSTLKRVAGATRRWTSARRQP